MELRIPAAVLEEIRAHARESYPEECCGFLVGREEGGGRIVTEARRARNAHPEMREARYTVDPRDTLAVERALRGAPVEVVGFYHSHPDGPSGPSPFDRQRAWPWYVYVIVAMREGGPAEVTAWRLPSDESPFEAVPVLVA